MHSAGKSSQFLTSNKAAPWLGCAMIRFICILIKKEKVCFNDYSNSKQCFQRNRLNFLPSIKKSQMKEARDLANFQKMKYFEIQLLTSYNIRFLNKPYVNWVTLREQNQPLNCCQPLDF